MNKYIRASFMKEMLIDDGVGGGAANDGISFNKGSLASALDEFEEIKTESLKTIENIETYLSAIEANWSGEQHDAAKTDKEIAERCLESARTMLGSVSGSVSMLSANANKVNYVS